MNLLYKYIISNLSKTFFPIFFVLFAVSSVIFLVKIASLTSIITMDFSELLFLYSLKIPVILLYTLPITYFVASILSIANISKEYELIVITSFGLSPLKILKIFIPISLLFTIAIFIISFILIPKAYYIENTFINKKKQEARFNITPSEYGQKFGPWYMYVESKTNDTYNDMILYQNDNGKDTFVIAKKANLKKNDTSLILELENGSSSLISDQLTFVEFYKMTLNNHLKQNVQISTLKDIINYWFKKQTSYKVLLLMENIFFSLLPILSILLFISVAYYNPRYQNNHASIYAIILVIIYMITAVKFSSSKQLYLLYVLPSIWIILSLIIYKIRIKNIY